MEDVMGGASRGLRPAFIWEILSAVWEGKYSDITKSGRFRIYFLT
jgi:hypothetical protein